MEDVKEYSDSREIKLLHQTPQLRGWRFRVRLPAYFIVALYRSHESPTILKGSVGWPLNLTDKRNKI